MLELNGRLERSSSLPNAKGHAVGAQPTGHGVQSSLGHLSRWLMGRLGRQRHHKVLLLGLDAAGKSTLLMRLRQPDSPITTAPTIGYDVDVFEHADVVYTICDVGGQRQLRSQWARLLTSGPAAGSAWAQGAERVSGVIFVVDAADPARWPEAREELRRLRDEPRLSETPFLVLANKMDLPFAQSPEALAAALQLTGELAVPGSTPCAVQGASTLEGGGVLAALEWIAENSSDAGR